MNERRFYVYAYYLKSTNHIFHIGKGTGNRYKNITQSRNQYFKNIINKYKNDVDVKILKDNLTENEAWDLEKELIAKYRKLNQCETNLHEGGCGGNTGNYNNPERSRKLSEAAKKRIGPKNPHYGKHLTEEQKKYLSKINKGKKLSEEHKQKLKEANKKPKTEEHKRKIAEANKGKHNMSKEAYQIMMDRECPFLYQIYLNNQLIFENISSKKLEEFCHNNLGISRTIIEKVIKKEWKPTFQKHQHLQNLQILKIDRKCIDQGR